MTIERWSRAQVERVAGELTLDDLDDVDVLVLEDVASSDDERLQWARRAPCVVVGVMEPGAEPSGAVDVIVDAGDARRLEELVAGVEAAPIASRVLVDVLRVASTLPVRDGLVVESLGYSTLLASSEFRSWREAHPSGEVATHVGDPVRVERRDGVLMVTLTRPENRNAFGAAMRDALAEALLPAIVDDTIVQVEIDAEGPNFSSGGDLTEFGTATDVALAHGIRTLRSVGAILDALGDRVHVRVHGTCVGAGIELPAFAANVDAAPDATFRLPEVSMGLIPGAGGTVSITRRIGRHRCAELALSGREVDATEALAIGLVDTIT